MFARALPRSFVNTAVSVRPTVGLRHYESVSEPRPITLQRYNGSLEDGKVTKWYVHEGQEVKQYDKVCDVSTAGGAMFTVNSPYCGVVHRVNLDQEASARVGTTLIEMNTYDVLDVEPLDNLASRDLEQYFTSFAQKVAIPN